MALVVLVRGLNVGGHRTFRPTRLAAQLRHLDAVNIGAAGTLVVRQPVDPATLRREVARRLPFDAEIVICRAGEIVRLMSTDPFAGRRTESDVVRFVSVLARPPLTVPVLPLKLPSRGKWLLEVLALEGRFVIGRYRRHMKVIGYLGSLDRVFGAPAATRNWNTFAAVRKVLQSSAPRPSSVDSGRGALR